MVDPIRFDGQVAVVTGAGNGMGRAHALLMAARGAAVVVNDYGGSLSGVGANSKVADAVVDEIRTSGGQAVANAESVHTQEGAASIVDTAIGTFGRVDIVVNNAGILIGESIKELGEDTWRRTLAVNLDGAMWVTKAAWPFMQNAGYGRVIFVSSTAGLLGTSNLIAYGASKAGIFGLMRGLSHEVGDCDLKINAILPGATTRMAGQASEEMIKRGNPDLVSPLVAYLASRRCAVNGEAYIAGAGHFARLKPLIGVGVRLGWDEPITPEDVAAHWSEINEMETPESFASMEHHAQSWFRLASDL